MRHLKYAVVPLQCDVRSRNSRYLSFERDISTKHRKKTVRSAKEESQHYSTYNRDVSVRDISKCNRTYSVQIYLNHPISIIKFKKST